MIVRIQILIAKTTEINILLFKRNPLSDLTLPCRLANELEIDINPARSVLPPSRFYAGEISVILCDFQGISGAFFFDIHLVSEVFEIFVIMEQVASVSLLMCFSMRYHSKEHIEVHLYELPNTV